MSDFPPLAAPWSRVALVHDDTDLFDPETMTALDGRFARTPKMLPAGTDLNNAFANGDFYASQPLNQPVAGANLWWVSNLNVGPWVRQTVTHMGDATLHFHRVRTEWGGWAGWKRFAFV